MEARFADRSPSLGGTKQRAVLAMLVLSPGRVVSVDQLADGLWGDKIPDSATNVVHTYISRLRRILSAGGPDDTGFGGLRRCRPGYLLELDPECIDLCRFERLNREGIGQLQTAPEAASATLRRALSLWRGRPLSEFVDLPFALPETCRLEEERLGANVARTDADLRLGRHAEIISELESLVADHPLHEGLCGQLMLSLFRSGRQAEALAAYRRVQQSFAEELGIDPSRALSELESAILARSPGLEWHPAPGVAAVRITTADTPAETRRARIWKVPARNPRFIGRVGLIDQLHGRLCSVDNTLVVEALFGLGGVGKTQLAIEYAHTFAAEYTVVWWIDADRPVLIPDQLVSLAGRLGLPTDGSAADVVDRLLIDLAERPGWLLIFDNAEHPDDIFGYRPGGSGHVLVTSRFPGWGALGGRLQIDVLTRSETVTLLQARIDQMDQAEAHALAAELGDLPLAAAQAAAYLEQTGLPPADYLRRFRTHRASLLGRGDVLGYQRRVDTAWDLSLKRLLTVSPIAVELLEMSAFLAPEPIPLTYFTDHPDLMPEAVGAAMLDGSDEVVDAVGAAVAFSLVSRSEDGFAVHRLLQAVIRHRLPPDREDAIGALAATVLAACDPGDPSNPDNWPSYSKLAPHLLATARWGEHNPAWRTMLLDTIRYFGVRGDARASRQIAQQSLERWVVALGSTHPSSLSLASTLTAALAWLGEGERACELGRDTLHKSRQTLGPDHPTTLGAATYLTSALAWTGANAEAANLGHDTLDRCRRTLGPDHRTTLGSAAQWSFTLLGLGEIQPARELSRDTWERSSRTLGPHHPTTLQAAAALVFALAWLGDARPAEDLGMTTIESCERAFGSDHWLTLLSASGLTFALVAGADGKRAVETSLSIADRAGRAYGADHWVTLVAAAARTFALAAIGDIEAAVLLGTQTLRRSSRTLGAEHPITVTLTEQLSNPGVADGT